MYWLKRMGREVRREGEITADVKERRKGSSPDCAGEEEESSRMEGESKEEKQDESLAVSFLLGEKTPNPRYIVRERDGDQNGGRLAE